VEEKGEKCKVPSGDQEGHLGSSCRYRC